MRTTLVFFLFFTLKCSFGQKQFKGVDQQRLDVAKYELYKINSYLNCNCLAIAPSENEKDKQDTMSVLSLNIDLDTVMHQNDTVIYYFNYYRPVQGKQKAQVLSSPYNGCSHYYAIAFHENNSIKEIPLFSLIDEFGVFVYTQNKMEDIDTGFKKCLGSNFSQLNPWLKEYLTKNGL